VLSFSVNAFSVNAFSVQDSFNLQDISLIKGQNFQSKNSYQSFISQQS